MGKDAVYRDRLAALERGGEATIAAAMARSPLLADVVAGDGPLAVRSGYLGYRFGTPQPVNRRSDLARVLALGTTIQLSMTLVNRMGRQLLAHAVWHGGVVDRKGTIAETGADPSVLDDAADALADLFLTDRSRGWVALRPGVSEWVHLPGQTIRRAAEHLTSEQLSQILRNLDLPHGHRKGERIDALEEALRDRVFVEDVLTRLDPESARVFDRLARLGRCKLTDLATGAPYGRNTPISRLVSLGLIGYDPWEQEAWIWLDVLVAMVGSLHSDWAVPTAPRVPVNEVGAASIPAVVGRLDQILDRWKASPPPALQSGGLGVRPIRATAKSLGLPSREVGLLASLAVELGLVGRVVTSARGRGRNYREDVVWGPTQAWEDWSAEPAWRRWAMLVQQWLDSDLLEVAGKAIERYEAGRGGMDRTLTRVMFTKKLAELGDSTGMEQQDLTDHLIYESALFAPAVIDQLVEEGRVLGIVTPTGAIGLTAAGRRLLEGSEALEKMAGEAPDHFTVQADHSVIAPPDLHPDVLAGLERFTRLESDAGARIYRINDDAVVGAIEFGWDADDVLAFLAAHSTSVVPQNVERTVRDAAARHGRLVVGSAATWVASEDPALVASAVAIRQARLQSITPTLAVSELPNQKVLGILRSKGLAPGDHSPASPPAEKPHWSSVKVELRPRPIRTDEDFLRLASGVVGGGEATTLAGWWHAELGAEDLDDLDIEYE